MLSNRKLANVHILAVPQAVSASTLEQGAAVHTMGNRQLLQAAAPRRRAPPTTMTPAQRRGFTTGRRAGVVPQQQRAARPRVPAGL